MRGFYFAVLGAGIVILVIATFSVAASPRTNPNPRTCFPAAKWSANQAKRPCVRVLNVHEDGSFSYSVENAGGTRRYRAGVGALDR